MRLAVILLAAGQSRRFGSRDKLRAALAGRPLAAHAARALAGLSRQVGLVVLRDPRLAGLFRGLGVVVPDRARPGQGRSVAAGIRAARRAGASHALLVLADMPCLGREDLRVIARPALAHPVMALGPEGPMPPALIPRRLFPALARLDGDRGAGPLLRRCPDLVLRPLPAARLIDVDRPDDLAAALAAARGDLSPQRSAGLPGPGRGGRIALPDNRATKRRIR